MAYSIYKIADYRGLGLVEYVLNKEGDWCIATAQPALFKSVHKAIEFAKSKNKHAEIVKRIKTIKETT